MLLPAADRMLSAPAAVMRLFGPPARQPEPPRFSLMQVIEMAGGSILAVIVVYTASTVASIPSRMEQMLKNQDRMESRVETIMRDQREMDRRLTRVEEK